MELHIVCLGAVHRRASGQQDGVHHVLQVLVPLVGYLEQSGKEIVESETPMALSEATILIESPASACSISQAA